MKVVAINGSPRKGGNTSILLKTVCNELEAQGIETHTIDLSGKKIQGCTACDYCINHKDRTCAIKDDAQSVIEAMTNADGLLLGSPVYFSDITAEMKAIIDRGGRVGRSSGSLYARKAGAAVIAVRRAGAIHAFDSIDHFFLINQMIIPGSSYWNIGVGREKGEVEKDEEGIQTMKTLGQNMGWLMKKISG